METTTLMSIGEYLETVNDQPEWEYIDGKIEERNMGTYDHARLQAAITVWFFNHEKEWHIRVVPEQHIQVSPTRYRIPDVTVLSRAQPIEQIFTRAPLLVVEVLSPSDSLQKFQERVDDYLAFGIPYIWIIDPKSKRAWIGGDGFKLTNVLEIPNSEIRLPLEELFKGDQCDDL